MSKRRVPCTKRTCCDLRCYRRLLGRPSLRCYLKHFVSSPIRKPITK